jgi:hypothetical protein
MGPPVSAICLGDDEDGPSTGRPTPATAVSLDRQSAGGGMSRKRNKLAAVVAELADTEVELIMTCARMLGLWHEREVLRAADEWAPDEGPVHPRYVALDKKEGQLRRRLLGLGIPTTRAGAVALANVAFLEAEKTSTSIIVAQDSCDQFALAVIQSLAGGNVPMTMSAEHYGAKAENPPGAPAWPLMKPHWPTAPPCSGSSPLGHQCSDCGSWSMP